MCRNLSVPGLFVSLFAFLSVLGRPCECDAQERGPAIQAAVAPPVGTVSRAELKTCAVEIREQLRFHGYLLAVQKDVRDALSRAGVTGKPSSGQLDTAGAALGSEIVFITVISGDASKGHFLDMAAQNVRTGNIRAVRAKLPSRGAAPFESKQLLPAVAACTAALVNVRPHPMHGPFPDVTPLNSARLIRRETSADVNAGSVVSKASVSGPSSAAPGGEMPVTKRPDGPPTKSKTPKEGTSVASKSKSAEKTTADSSSLPTTSHAKTPAAKTETTNRPAPTGPPDPADKKAVDTHESTESSASDTTDAASERDKKKIDWKRWDHAGIFGELGFMFSWCNRGGICDSTSKGYGARLRLGVRIASFVSLSFAAMAVDHQMPITTDTEVFLNVEKAFVYAGIFGGLRVHPVRRFPVDPYVGVDLGYSWLLYAQNTAVDVETDPNIPEKYAEQLAELINFRRETLYLQGFTVAPEIGVNFFVAPPLAFGVHVQWILPFWKAACSRVYNPSVQGMEAAPQICASPSAAASTEGYDEQTVALLSSEDNLPRFVSLELDLTFVFK